MTFHAGTIRIRIHPLLPAMWALGALSGSGSTLWPSIAALALHEIGHLLCACLLHIPIDEIELTVFGGLMRCDTAFLSRLKRIMLSISGPVFSFLGYLICYVLLHAPTEWAAFLLDSLRSHLLLLLINLLPVMPLDGGQALLACLDHLPNARRLLTGAGYLSGIALIGLSIYFAIHSQLLLAPAFAGCCLIYAAAVEQRDAAGQSMHTMVLCGDKLAHGQVVKTTCWAAAGDMPLIRLARQLPSAQLSLIRVYDEHTGHYLGEVTNREICTALMNSTSGYLRDLFAAYAQDTQPSPLH